MERYHRYSKNSRDGIIRIQTTDYGSVGGPTSIRQSGRALALLRCTLAHLEIGGIQARYLPERLG